MRDFGSLLTPPNKTEEEEAFTENIRAKNIEFERLMENSPCSFLNCEISVEEFEKAVNRSKNNKAPGFDSLTYETLRDEKSIQALTVLFNRCLTDAIVPSTWVKRIISPIPRSASSDPRVPLNHRGIRLLPVISKLFSGIISTRASAFLEANNLIANEQNGFRPD